MARPEIIRKRRTFSLFIQSTVLGMGLVAMLVKSCHGEAELSDAIQQMLLRDVQRIFVHGSDPAKINGVLSLSDAARFRSGSCRACTASRLMQQ